MKKVFEIEIPSDDFLFFKKENEIFVIKKINKNNIEILKNIPNLKQISCSIGKFAKSEFIPNHGFAMLFGQFAKKNIITLDKDSSQKFVENLDIDLNIYKISKVKDENYEKK